MNSVRAILAQIFLGLLITFFSTTTHALERANLGPGGVEANDEALHVDISADGRFIVFDSYATNLLPEDSDAIDDVYLLDRQTGELELISVNSDEMKGNGTSDRPAVSDDGNYVVFASSSTNLVAGRTGGIYLRNRLAGTTEFISVTTTGGQASSATDTAISGNGMFVAFRSFSSNLVDGDTNGKTDIFLRDVMAGTTERISISQAELESDDHSYDPCVSYDGSYVAFESEATNLVDDDFNGDRDVFVRDRILNDTIRVSVGGVNTEGNNDSTTPTISSDGKLVAFNSYADNLIGAADTNVRGDIFVRDINAMTTERVSVPTGGGEANGSCYSPSMSPSGKYVAFFSDSSNLVNGFSLGEIYVHNRVTNETTIVSEKFGGGETTSIYEPEEPVVGNDGTVAFSSEADDLVETDTNMVYDVFYDPGSFGMGVPYDQGAVIQLNRKIKKLKKRIKQAKRKKKSARAKRLNKKVRKLKRRVRRIIIA